VNSSHVCHSLRVRMLYRIYVHVFRVRTVLDSPGISVFLESPGKMQSTPGKSWNEILLVPDSQMRSDPVLTMFFVFNQNSQPIFNKNV